MTNLLHKEIKQKKYYFSFYHFYHKFSRQCRESNSDKTMHSLFV